MEQHAPMVKHPGLASLMKLLKKEGSAALKEEFGHFAPPEKQHLKWVDPLQA